MTTRQPALAVRRLAISTLALTGAVASVLSPARALTLGEVSVESSIGQPLNARIPVELATGEILTAGCISSPAGGTADLSRVPMPTFGVPETSAPGTQSLRITTSQPLYEPMYELQLQVRCPGTALLVRQYILMLDLPVAASQPVADVTATIAEARAADEPLTAAAPPASQRPARARRPQASAASREPIAAGTTYRVQQGDTLSTIAARVSDRGGANIWQFAERIFAANPGAFIGANPDMIQLGTEILIPAGDNPMAAEATPVAADGNTAEQPLPGTPEQPVPEVATTPVQEAAASTPDAEVAEASLNPPVETDAAETGAGNSAPADDATAAVFAEETPPAGAIESAMPVTAAPRAEDAGSSPPSWLAALMGLLIGAGASLILLRDRLIDAVRRSPAPANRSAATSSSHAQSARTASKAPLPIRTVPAREPSMVVVEKSGFDTQELRAAQGWAGARPAQATEPTSEPTVETTAEEQMAELFGPDEDHDPVEPQATETLEAYTPSDLDLDLDLSEAAASTKVDQEIGRMIGDEGISQTATNRALAFGTAADDLMDPSLSVEVPRAKARDGEGDDTVDQLDLHTMAQMAPGDAHLAETLQEALELLESDYEDELSTSQRIDNSKLKQAHDGDDEDDTLARTGTDRTPRPRPRR